MCPNYVSKDGVWYPAKEKVGLTNNGNKTISNPSEEGSKHAGEKIPPGEPWIYEGPDRAALLEQYKEGVSNFGENFRHNAEFLQGIRNVGFNEVDDFLKMVGYDKEKVETNFKKNASVINKHELPKRVAAIDRLGGGKDFSGEGEDVVGGFGEEKRRLVKDVKK